jgi:vacuolar iron transporter family protein
VGRGSDIVRLIAAGAIFPVVPFLWMRGPWAVWESALLSGIVLGTIGMLTSLFNGRSPWYFASRQLIFGCLAAAVTMELELLWGRRARPVRAWCG